MGIILLTELGTTPWQLRFSQFSPLPDVSQLMLDTMDMGLLLPTTPMVDLATPTEAPRVLEATTVTTRERLRPAMDMDLLLPTIPMVDPATPPEVSRVLVDTSTRERLRLATDMDPLLPTTPMVDPATPTEAPRVFTDTSTRERPSPAMDITMDLALPV